MACPLHPIGKRPSAQKGEGDQDGYMRWRKLIPGKPPLEPTPKTVSLIIITETNNQNNIAIIKY